MSTNLKNSSTKYVQDEEKIKGILNGEKELYGQIMRKYNQRMYRICMSIVANPNDVEDIMQTTYIKAYENLHKFKFESEFSTWLIKILINESLKFKQKTLRISWINDNAKSDELTNETPLYKMMNKELKSLMEKALGQLPEKYRLVFIMREVEDMSIAETMECLSLTEANVKVRLNRAKEMLRSSLSKYYKTEELYDFHLSRCDKIVNYVTAIIQRY